MAEDRRLAEAPDAHEDEEATVIAAQGRDPVALTLLYERYVRPVYRYLYSQIGDAADAEDLTSQTFLSALEALPRYRPGHSIPGLARSVPADCRPLR